MYGSLKYNTIWLISSRDNSKCVPLAEKGALKLDMQVFLNVGEIFCIIALDVFCGYFDFRSFC